MRKENKNALLISSEPDLSSNLEGLACDKARYLPYDRSGMAKFSVGRGPVTDRLTVSATDQKILFALSGNVCAFPECNRRLIEPATMNDDAAVVGHIAHIVGASRQGPRGAEAL